ncbi:C-type lectin domain family 2 member B-like isoform X1 [Anas acuta]|uniref:C-type lectin domain family 2 member B-like isoform X1 n=1 Tax=Anas acuta TaxID=28680 RepID=UPI0035C91A6E
MCLETGQPTRGASWGETGEGPVAAVPRVWNRLVSLLRPLFSLPMGSVCSHLSFWKTVAGIVFCFVVIFILIGVILHSPALLDLEPCPDDWLYYKRKCYYHSGSVADWNSSQKFCSDFGASLAVIDHPQDLEFIVYRMRTIDFWIGLQKTENKFFWVNGESLNTNLFHVNISDDGDCVHINSAFVSTKKCSSQRNWLCTLGQFDPKTIS